MDTLLGFACANVEQSKTCGQPTLKEMAQFPAAANAANTGIQVTREEPQLTALGKT